MKVDIERESSRILVLYIGIFENEIYITWYIGILQNGISVYLYIVEWNICIFVYCGMEYPYIGISIHIGILQNGISVYWYIYLSINKLAEGISIHVNFLLLLL